MKRQQVGKNLFRQLEGCTEEAIAATGQLNLPRMVNMLEVALADERTRAVVLFALAEFIGTALDGSVIDIRTWVPRLGR